MEISNEILSVSTQNNLIVGNIAGINSNHSVPSIHVKQDNISANLVLMTDPRIICMKSENNVINPQFSQRDQSTDIDNGSEDDEDDEDEDEDDNSDASGMEQDQFGNHLNINRNLNDANVGSLNVKLDVTMNKTSKTVARVKREVKRSNQSNISDKHQKLMESRISSERKEKREKISLKDKERLVKAHDEGADYIDLGDKMGINRHTVHSIITLWRKSGVLSRGRVGGHKKHMITEELGDKLIDFVEQNPLHTLKEMKEYMETFGIRPTVQTISNFLHGKCIAIKKPNPGDTTNDVKTARYEYVRNILDNNISMKQCIFVDECVFNFWIRSPYGKYTKGTRDYKHCCGQKETSLTVVMAIATTGVVHYKVCYGPLSRTGYEEFILELSMQLGDGHFYIIQEASPSRNSVQPAFENHQTVFLPPQSAFLSPLTGVFGRLKQLIKRSMPPPSDIVRMSMGARKEMLRKIAEEIIPANFYCSMNTHYSATVKFFSKCIFKDDIIPNASW